MLKHRIVTAAVLIPAVLAALHFLSSAAIAWVFALVALLGAYEWAGLTGLTTTTQRCIYIASVLAFMLLLAMTSACWRVESFPFSLTLLATGWWCVVVYWLVDYEAGRNRLPQSRWFLRAAGLLVLGSAWAALTSVHALPQRGPGALMVLMLLVWGADIGAFFAGRRWGVAKMAPRLSPGKTWAGAIGALAVGLVIGFTSSGILGVSAFGGIVIAVITVVFSVAGDLFESLLKRLAGVKDSGRLLPGHGGVLDRIDSLLAAAPVFAISAYLMESL